MLYRVGEYSLLVCTLELSKFTQYLHGNKGQERSLVSLWPVRAQLLLDTDLTARFLLFPYGTLTSNLEPLAK